jgi:transposase
LDKSEFFSGGSMNKKYIVDLQEEERRKLQRIIHSGKHSARKIRWAHVLLKADQCWKDEKIAEAFDISLPTVQRIRQRFVEEGLDVALGAHSHKPRPYRQKLDGEQEAKLIALACSKAPEGHTRWSLRLLADKLVELQVVDEISYQTVRRVLKKHHEAVAG